MLDYFSHSRLQSYKKCPAQFYIRYIEGVRKPDEGIEAFLGKRIHETLEHLYSRQLATEFPPSLDTVLASFSDLWKSNWHSRIAIVNRFMGVRDYFRLGESMLARFYRIHFPFDQPVIATEERLEFSLDDSGNYLMVGILDRVDRLNGKGIVIHDYKTGKRALTQQAADKDEQLALYQLGWELTREPAESFQLVWHFLQPGFVVHSTRTSDELTRLKKKIICNIDQIRDHVEGKKPFMPHETKLCYWCYYWEECPAKQGSNPVMKHV
ncbi:MAG: PD-(D/E)XK nuclease family protein [FCB group bacterium]|nr:PD-(D/E)XK nuclease family protein [FCB group bacterium]